MILVKKQPPKQKPPLKTAEITMIIKHPFKITQAPIQQPPIKVVDLPNIVHIIERKPKKEQPIPNNEKPKHVHIIQTSKNKVKMWRFENLNKASDDEKDKKEVQNQKKVEQRIPIQKEKDQIQNQNKEMKLKNMVNNDFSNEKQRQQEKLNEKIDVQLYPIQQSYNPKQNKRTLFRNLQLPKQIKQESIALPQQSDFYEGRQSLKHKRALLVMKDKQGQMYHQQIVIPEQFELKQENKPIINLKRNLKHQQNDQPVNEKISSSAVNFYPIDKNVQLYPIQQSYNPKQNKRTLFRNLQLPKQIKQESIALPQQSDFYEGRQSLKHKRALLVMKDKQGQMYHQQIVIPEQFELKQENKPIINLKRNLKHQQNDQPVNEKISSSAVNFYPIDKNVQLYPIQQSYNPKQNKRTLFRNLQLPKQIKQESIALPQQSDFYEGRQSLKHKRALLVMKDKQGQMYHQQIVIPEQFELKQENKPIINLKRNLKHQQNDQPVNEKISSSAVNFYPIDKNVQLYPIQQSYNPKQNKRTLFRNLQLPKQIKQESIALPQQSDFYEGRQSLKHKRALLVMKDKQGQMYHQQIVIPEQFELKQENKPIINLKRNLKHQQNDQPVNEKISSSAVNFYPIDKNVQLYPIQQSYNPKQNKRTLFRNLQLPKQIKQESIALPQQSDFYEGRQSLKHKRALLVMKDKQGQMYHQQIVIPEQFELKQENKPIINLKRNLKHQQNDQPVNEKISSSAVNFYPIDKNVQLYPIQQSYNPKQNKRTLFRNLQLPKQIKQESIALPQQSDFYEGRQSLKHKRALLVMKDKQGQMYHQQIVIPEQFELKQENKPIINLKRNLKHQQNDQPVNEKISSSAVNFYPIDKNVQLYPIQQSYNPKQNKRTLFRNLQLPKQIKQESIALPQQSDFYEGRQSLKHKRALLVMKDKQGQMYHQQIVIPEQFELKQENKPIINLKRNLKHQQNDQPVNEKISSSAVNFYPIDKNVQLYPIQQSYNPKQNKRTLFRNLQLPKQIKQESIALPQQSDFYEGRQSLKHKRALLVMKDKQGQMYHQQIVIPEQFELKQENKPIINLKRNLKHQQNDQPVNEKISSSAVNFYPIDKNVQLYPIQQSYNPKQNKRTLFRNLQLPKQIKQESIALPQQSDFYEGRQSLKHKRALLVMKDKQGQMYHQQIVIPEQFELKQENKPIINLKRNLKHQQNDQPVNEKISSSAVNFYPIDKNVQLYPIQQSYNPKQNKRTLFRNLQLPKQIKQESIALPQQSDFYEGRQSLKHKRALLVMKDTQGQMYHQQIVIPEQFELKQENKPIINLKRNLKHQQNDQPVNEKISSSIVNTYVQPANLLHYNQPPLVNTSLNADKSYCPSTLNSSLPQQTHVFQLSSSQQQSLSPSRNIKLKRILLPQKINQNPILSKSLMDSKIFNVYNPKLYLSDTSSVTTDNLPVQTSTVRKPPRPHRRPGFYS